MDYTVERVQPTIVDTVVVSENPEQPDIGTYTYKMWSDGLITSATHPREGRIGGSAESYDEVAQKVATAKEYIAEKGFTAIELVNFYNGYLNHLRRPGLLNRPYIPILQQMQRQAEYKYIKDQHKIK